MACLQSRSSQQKDSEFPISTHSLKTSFLSETKCTFPNSSVVITEHKVGRGNATFPIGQGSNGVVLIRGISMMKVH